jgi:hypothetical protein
LATILFYSVAAASYFVAALFAWLNKLPSFTALIVTTANINNTIIVIINATRVIPGISLR